MISSPMPQLDELRAVRCNRIYQKHGSAASRARPVLTRLLGELTKGDVLVVVRLDRLARSVSHLLSVIEDLEERGVHFRSIRDPIDTSTPQGMFSLRVLGAVAQLARALIAERTKAGIKAAKARGLETPACESDDRKQSRQSREHARNSISTSSSRRRRPGSQRCGNSGRNTVGTMSCECSIAAATTGQSSAFVAPFTVWSAKSSRKRNCWPAHLAAPPRTT